MPLSLFVSFYFSLACYFVSYLPCHLKGYDYRIAHGLCALKHFDMCNSIVRFVFLSLGKAQFAVDLFLKWYVQ